MITHLEGFTPLVERSRPLVVVPALNNYLDGMIRIAFDYDGTVDKIVGDAVHVMFGAPVADPRLAERALACALAFDAFACAFADEQQRSGLAFGGTRIGVNAGLAIVGNFGGALRFLDYTAHGDVINTASRLEGANKLLGTRICVSEAVVERCTGFVGRPAATLLLKGKTQPVRVFERCRRRLPARRSCGHGLKPSACWRIAIRLPKRPSPPSSPPIRMTPSPGCTCAGCGRARPGYC